MADSPILPCVFCDIARGVLPASLVYEDELVLAFMDLNPITTGHLLVIPRVHASSLDELVELTGERMFTVGTRMAGALRGSSIVTEGINLFLADGEAAGQEVFHAHLHVIPRFRSDGVVVTGDFTINQERMILDGHAAQLRSLLQA